MTKLIIIIFGYEVGGANNANAICLSNLFSYLSKHFEILLVTSTDAKSVINYKESTDIEILKVPYQKDGSNKINFSDWEKEVLREITMYKIDEFTKLLTISFPFSILEIGYKLKKSYPHLQWSIYELDPYAYNKLLRYPRLLFYYRYLKERKVLNLADQIFLTHELFNTYSKSLFRKLTDKFLDIGIPLLEIYERNNGPQVKKGNLKFAYIGSLYHKIRSPAYLLELLATQQKSEINFYGPEPDEIPQKYKEIFKNRLEIHGRISRLEVEKVIKESDVLINIGNKVDNQLPSKVLEYIGTGRPIVSIESIENDTSHAYLINYPMSLILNEKDDFTQNKHALTNFLLNIRTSYKVEPDELEEIYKNETVQAVAERMINALSNQ